MLRESRDQYNYCPNELYSEEEVAKLRGQFGGGSIMSISNRAQMQCPEQFMRTAEQVVTQTEELLTRVALQAENSLSVHSCLFNFRS